MELYESHAAAVGTAAGGWIGIAAGGWLWMVQLCILEKKQGMQLAAPLCGAPVTVTLHLLPYPHILKRETHLGCALWKAFQVIEAERLAGPFKASLAAFVHPTFLSYTLNSATAMVPCSGDRTLQGVPGSLHTFHV